MTIDNAEFDRYAEEYDAALAEGLSVSGESKDFFAQGRVAWLARQLRQLNEAPRSVLDYGCGTGSAIPYLLDIPAVTSVVGVDVSSASLEVAERTWGDARVHFVSTARFQPRAEIDLAFCNGVFHHIPVAERAAAVDFIHRSLRPGGLFAFWENNPFNPGTRYVMSKCPFDEDAITLTHFEARRLLRRRGFDVIRTTFLFIFPRLLRRLRPLERFAAPWPIGAQYLILCRKPT